MNLAQLKGRAIRYYGQHGNKRGPMAISVAGCRRALKGRLDALNKYEVLVARLLTYRHEDGCFVVS